MSDIYIHIGYPKNLSTTLQVDYFNKHPDIYHLGAGINYNTGYIDKKMTAFIENIFFYANNLFYDDIKDEVKEHIQYHYNEFKRSGKKVFTLSLEHLSFSLTPGDIDLTTKFERLKELFGKDINIISIIRSQDKLIKSLYGETVKMGYPYDFRGYIDHLYYNQYTSYMHEIRYHKTYQYLIKQFNSENITFIPLEKYRDNEGKLLENQETKEALIVKRLNDLLNIKSVGKMLSHNNKSLNAKELFQKVLLNKKYPHEFGGTVLDQVQRHRMKEFFEYYFEEEFMNIYGDVKQKRLTIEMAKELALNDNRKLDYSANINVLKKLQKVYEDSNRMLSEQIPIELPNNYFNLSF